MLRVVPYTVLHIVEVVHIVIASYNIWILSPQLVETLGEGLGAMASWRKYAKGFRLRGFKDVSHFQYSLHLLVPV